MVSLLLSSSSLCSRRSYRIKSQSDESSESLVLYTLAQIGVQSLWVGDLHGGTPYPLFFVSCHMTLVLDFDWVLIFI